MNTTPIYRFYSNKAKAHFFTISESEKDFIISNYESGIWDWRYEGVAYYAYEKESISSCSDGNLPVYRFYSSSLITHFFTASENDKQYLIDNYDENTWRYEGIGFCADNITGDNLELHYEVQNLAGGPNITVGLYDYTENDLEDNSFRIRTNKTYIIKDKNGNKIATIPANTTTRVKYLNDSSHNLKIYESIPDIITPEKITFEAEDGFHSNTVFEIVRPEITYSEYRGKIKLNYSNNNNTKRIWVINELPLEQYVWGMGEITGTGPTEYNKVMTTAYRTYGLWKILYSTKYAIEGFKVDATPGNQLYKGYEWEVAYPRIREAAEMTRGNIVMYDDEVTIIPYSSWTDGETRSFEERWGSTLYPWCQSVNDPYGDYNNETYWDNSIYKSTSTLESEGNHMVGISAHGALSLAFDHNWSWNQIINYYLDNVWIDKRY